MPEDDRAEQAAYRRCLDETFATIRSAIGGKPEQIGASRVYGRSSEQAMFRYHTLSDEEDVESR